LRIIASISNIDITSVEEANLAFVHAYKEIAHTSIESYKNTKEKFKKLTQKQQKTINDYSKQHSIDIDIIAKKFQDVQDHMCEEINRANEVIEKLNKKIKMLEEETNLDALTKTFNRRALDSYLRMVCGKKKLKYELHMFILDIDDFKVINDKHGHVAGDKVLIFIANILKKALRDGDKIFRYGGEEFVVVLNRIDMQYCKSIANRILRLINSNKLIYKGDTLNVTVSMGTTKMYEDDTPDSFIARADKALYRAKANGKNQIQTEL